MLAHSSIFKKLKEARTQLKPKDLVTKPLYGLEEDASMQFIKLCVISSNLFYSLIGAIYLDSNLDYEKTRKIALEMVRPVAVEHVRDGFIEEFAPYKVEKICEERGLERPVLKKVSLEEKESYKHPAMSMYELWIGHENYGSLKESSSRSVEHGLYVFALEKLLSE